MVFYTTSSFVPATPLFTVQLAPSSSYAVAQSTAAAAASGGVVAIAYTIDVGASSVAPSQGYNLYLTGPLSFYVISVAPSTGVQTLSSGPYATTTPALAAATAIAAGGNIGIVVKCTSVNPGSVSMSINRAFFPVAPPPPAPSSRRLRRRPRL